MSGEKREREEVVINPETGEIMTDDVLFITVQHNVKKNNMELDEAKMKFLDSLPLEPDFSQQPDSELMEFIQHLAKEFEDNNNDPESYIEEPVYEQFAFQDDQPRIEAFNDSKWWAVVCMWYHQMQIKKKTAPFMRKKLVKERMLEVMKTVRDTIEHVWMKEHPLFPLKWETYDVNADEESKWTSETFLKIEMKLK